jgi:hypothetical protein
MESLKNTQNDKIENVAFSLFVDGTAKKLCYFLCVCIGISWFLFICVKKCMNLIAKF